MRIAQSSHIYAHDYDPATQTLSIQFVNGQVYKFAGVPQTEYDSFTQASSPGAFFHSKIKGQYRGHNALNGNPLKGSPKR